LPEYWKPRLTANTVVRSDFRTIRRGYDPDEVTAHLARVADVVADLESRIAEFEANLREVRGANVVAPRTGPTAGRDDDAVASRVTALLRTLEEEEKRLESRARSDADGVVARARNDADGIRAEAARIRAEARAESERAHAEAARILDQARADAGRAGRGMDARQKAFVAELRALRDRARDAATRLGASIEAESPRSVRVLGPDVEPPDRRGGDDDREPRSTADLGDATSGA
jgi:DivIVA domain-containing protein